jgi:outer membrane protein
MKTENNSLAVRVNAIHPPWKGLRRFPAHGLTLLTGALMVFPIATHAPAATNAIARSDFHAALSQPLSLADALDLALQQNAGVLRARSELEAAHGLMIQTRAIALPRLRSTANYTETDPGAVDRFPFSGEEIGRPFNQPHRNWNANIQIVQSIYEGGRITSSLRAARLTREQAVLQYQTAIADTLLAVRSAYYDVLLAAQQITVQEASINLLTRELEDQQRRFNAGTVPRFNVLRAEVEVSNARPQLIRARNAHRIAKNNLVNLLGLNLPREVWEDIPLQLAGTLEAEPYDIELPLAISQALERRTELGALRAEERLRQEAVADARAGYRPSVQLFAGYGARNSAFSTDLTREVSGWNAGGQLSWDIFDGFLTRGRVQQARALHERAQVDVDDAGRRVELEVRTAYSNFIEAREVLDSQRKVQEEADEALRLAQARSGAGTGTQLDVLIAQTALTQARTTQIQALRDYAVARARLERAIGVDVTAATTR